MEGIMVMIRSCVAGKVGRQTPRPSDAKGARYSKHMPGPRAFAHALPSVWNTLHLYIHVTFAPISFKSLFTVKFLVRIGSPYLKF